MLAGLTIICALALRAAFDIAGDGGQHQSVVAVREEDKSGRLCPLSERERGPAGPGQCTTPHAALFGEAGVLRRPRLRVASSLTHTTTSNSSRPSLLSSTMKFLVLLALVSAAVATPLALYGNEQSPLGDVLPTEYPGFDLDLDAPRLVQLEGQEEPVVMTELEKVPTCAHADPLHRSHVVIFPDSGEGSGHPVLRCVSRESQVRGSFPHRLL